jgi:predicted dehydrogenase
VTEPCELGLVGCGHWGRHILRDLRTLGCRVHVVARSAESVERARGGGAASVVASIAELPALSGYVVATPTSTHAEIVAELVANRSEPVFVEKPLCTSSADAEHIVAIGGSRVFVMDKWRYHPGVLELARIARAGELGAVSAIHARRVTDANRHPDVDTVWTHAPHDLSIASEILGEVPPARFAVAELEGTRRVGLVGTLGGPPWFTFEISCRAPGHRRELRMVCEQGTAVLDGGWAEEVVILREDADPERRGLDGELPLLAELRAFVGHLAGGSPPKSTAAEGAEVVRRIEELGTLAEPA